MPRFQMNSDIALNPAAGSDRDRLERAELAIEIARTELECLELDGEDLNYLIEIVQLGVRRARQAVNAKEEMDFLEAPKTRPN